MSRARWPEYRELLRGARREGYELWSLEEWLFNQGSPAPRAIILRHDVDQHPLSVLPMLSIERELGVRSTWYFRWRTASPEVIGSVRAAGGRVGLHYETLTRLVRERGLSADDVDDDLVAEAREILRREIAAFRRCFGDPVQTVCPHGDSRVPGVSNQILLEGEDQRRYGIELDGNDAVDRLPLSLWLTDRSTPDGRWKDGIEPHQVLAAGTSPILLVTHPNNWCSGLSLWYDRALAAALPPAPASQRRPARVVPVRTGVDDPPALPSPEPPLPRSAADTPPAIDVAPVLLSLRREVLRFYYDEGKTMTDAGGLNTLATNAELAESRAAMLEYAVSRAGLPTLRGLNVVDLGCGFGALAAVFAARGARVLALDPNESRLRVGRRVAELHGLTARFERSSMEEMELREEGFDVAVMNNSLCYIVELERRAEALRRTWAALRPGGVLVIRNPNRWHPRDQFTGLPLLGTLPPATADAISEALGRHRSRVRLLSRAEAREELEDAGFVNVRNVRRPDQSWLRASVTGYQHLIARRPSR